MIKMSIKTKFGNCNIDKHGYYIIGTRKEGNENNELLKRCNPDFECPDMIKEDWLSYSKKKNMLKFENNNRTTHTRADMLFQLERWRTMAYFLNEEENKYLAEFRDALLPLLMSGELSVEEPEEIEAK